MTPALQIEPEDGYEITPKGWLMMKTGLPAHYICDVWDEFGEFVKKRAMDRGAPDGIPCLVFQNGGVCITVVKEEK